MSEYNDKDKPRTQVLEQAVTVISRHDFVRSAYVFGSYARRDADDNSDLDLIVDIEKNKAGYGMAFVGLSLELEEILGMSVDLLTLDGVRRAESFPGMPQEAVKIYERV